ncbi:MAG: class I SAM-dependent methyltransferase [Pseudomonadota bacterium]
MKNIDRNTFYRTYENLIEGKEFVEYKEYYLNSRERFWRSFRKICQLKINHDSTGTLDIGGGIMAVLLQELLGHEVYVGDVNERAAADVTKSGISFMHVDLTSDSISSERQYDLIVLQEVIEHIPEPPYITFKKIKSIMNKGGSLIITTPNGYRLRNILYMILNMNILDKFRYPGPGESMGHQQEYRLDHMIWHVEQSGLSVEQAELYDDGWRGSTLVAKIFWKAAALFSVIPHLRNGIMIIAKND